MAKFYESYNNGVVAIISEEDAKRYGMIRKAEGNPALHPEVRVFTFCSKERYDRAVTEQMVFTGTYEDMQALMEAGGHEFSSVGSDDWNGYVPFSNGFQYGTHGDEQKERELQYVTSLRDVLEVFRILSMAGAS